MTATRYQSWMPLLVFGAIAWFFTLSIAAGVVLTLLGVPYGILVALGPAPFYAWILYAFFHYRHGRQDELLQLLTAAVESQAPLVPALRTYVEDRPQGSVREFWIALLLFPVFPGYYWLWHRERSFDRKVKDVASLLEHGYALHDALELVPGVASRETIWAAGLGQATGKLALCLRASAQPRPATVWLQLLPRFAYPLVLLLVIVYISGGWMIVILPKFQRIFLDFGQKLPKLTTWMVESYRFLLLGLGGALLAIIALLGLLLVSPTVLWFFPGLGRLYRMHIRGRVLKMLGILLEAGKPVPEAFRLLVDSGYFTRMVERRLEKACGRVEEGEPLADSLRRGRLLPRAMVSLVQAAGRAQNLPWALGELGENLSSRSLRLMQRTSMLVGPVLVFAIGLLVAFMVIGMFLPLVDLIERLGE